MSNALMRAATALLLSLPLIAGATNTPCSGSKDGIGHCQGTRFVCHDGTISQSKRSCSAPQHVDRPRIERDAHGRIKRSSSAKRDFEKQNPCPSTGKTSGVCSGYVIDHVQPLKRGGEDAPSNMQWQTTADAKAKDKWE